jgi:uncharacterized protein YkwD
VDRPHRQLAALSILVALASPVAAFADGLPGLPEREALLDMMNDHRERRGLSRLRLNRKLNAAAEDRIRDMFDRRYFGHVAPDGTQPDVWVRRRGYDYTRIGENLATGQRSARAVVDHWMRSRGHRATILGKFDDAGIAIAEGSPTAGRKRGYTFVALYARDR